MTSRAKHLAVAVLSGIAGRAIGLLTPLLVMGPMLEHLGPTLFGIWLTAVALSAMGAFLDFGIGNAAMTYLSGAFGRGDQPTVRRILGEAYALQLGLSGVFLTVVGASYALFSMTAAMGEKADQAAVFAVVLTGLFLSLPATLIWRFLQARQSFLRAQLAQMVGPLVALIACLWGIRFGLSPVLVIAFYALAAPAALAVWTLLHFAVNPDERPAFRGIDLQSLRRFMALGGAFFTLSIFTLIGMNADNVIIAARAGAEVVAEYGVPAKLGGILMLVVSAVFMPLWPMFGNALAQKDIAWLRVTTFRMSFGGAAAVLVIGLCMTALADPIMMAWMGRSFADQHLILLGWTIAASVIAVTAPYNMVLNAHGVARPQILPWVAFVLASIGAKAAVLGPETAWWAPWITAGVYAVTITPRMIVLARQSLLELGKRSKHGAT